MNHRLLQWKFVSLLSLILGTLLFSAGFSAYAQINLHKCPICGRDAFGGCICVNQNGAKSSESCLEKYLKLCREADGHLARQVDAIRGTRSGYDVTPSRSGENPSDKLIREITDSNTKLRATYHAQYLKCWQEEMKAQEADRKAKSDAENAERKAKIDAEKTKRKVESDAYWYGQKAEGDVPRLRRQAEVRRAPADEDMGSRIKPNTFLQKQSPAILKDTYRAYDKTLTSYDGSSRAVYSEPLYDKEGRPFKKDEHENRYVDVEYFYSIDPTTGKKTPVRAAAGQSPRDSSAWNRPGEITMPRENLNQPARPAFEEEKSAQDIQNEIAEDTTGIAANAIGNAVEGIKDTGVDYGLQPGKDIVKEHTTDQAVEKFKERFDLPSSSEEEPPAYSVAQEYKDQADKSSDQVKDLNPIVRKFTDIIDRIGQKSGQMLDNPNDKVGGDNGSSGYQSGPAPGPNRGYSGSAPNAPGVQPIQWPAAPSTVPADPFQNLPKNLKTPSPSPTPTEPAPLQTFGKWLKNLGRPAPSSSPAPKPAAPVDLFGNSSKKQ